VFGQTFAECHTAGGARTLTLIPGSEIGTDPHRLATWTDPHGTPTPTTTRATSRASALSRKLPERRPAGFVRGLDLLDGERGGFRSPSCDPASPPAQGFCYDTRLRGNSNAGHVYGAGLEAGRKAYLLAYLLTL
jgi:hypothetical protein